MTRSSLNLSIVATVFLPLSFITGLLGMNVGGIPDEHNPFGFWLVTGFSILISVVAWRWLRRQTFDRYQPRANIGKKEPERLAETLFIDDAGSTPAFKEVKGERSKHFDPLPNTEVGRQDKSDGTKTDRKRPGSHQKIGRVYIAALLLALLLFFFHVVVILDVAGEILGHQAWLQQHFAHLTGKVIILGCFFVLFAAHVAESAAWGLFLRGARLLPSVTEGIYFTAASITTLGYGDVLLKRPWRHLGTLIAIAGVLMFGCSTAFLFVVLQDVWAQHL